MTMGCDLPAILAIDRAVERARAAFEPPELLPMGAWIERTLRLPSDVSATPGPVALFPFQRGIADAIGDPAIERVTLVKSVRVGLSTLLTGALAYFAVNEPCPIMALLPTEDDSRGYVVSDLEPIFAASPELERVLSADADEAGRNTLLARRFAGGSLKVIAARAPRNLRRHNVRVLLIDEADAMLPSAEGDPIILAERRTLSFANRKIVMGSTPVLEDTSNVLRAYARSDMRVFELPCPSCGGFHEITWAAIEWEADRPETAAYRCPSCAELIHERHKVGMIEGGRWRATAPNVQGHAGFRINALASPLRNASWGRLATEFLDVKADPARLQVFVNTILAEGWRETEGEEVSDAALAARAEPFGLDAIPTEVIFITSGVDVQDDRLECTLMGWSQDGTSFVLAHVVLWGASTADTTWAELDELLKTKWQHPGGGMIGVDAVAVDAGDGGLYERVLSFCAPRMSRRIVAIKGAGGTRPAITASHAKKQHGARLWIVGVDGIKAEITARLARGTSIRFSHDLEAVYFEQVASERRVLRYVKGIPIRRWERIAGRRAEALDCLVYAKAARGLVTIPTAVREAALCQEAAPKAAPAVIRSAWLTQGGLGQNSISRVRPSAESRHPGYGAAN